MPVQNYEKATTPTTDPLDPMHNRNEWRWGFTPQAELWNGRLAMLGFVAYLFWDAAGYSVVRDVLHLVG